MMNKIENKWPTSMTVAMISKGRTDMIIMVLLSKNNCNYVSLVISIDFQLQHVNCVIFWIPCKFFHNNSTIINSNYTT